VSPSARSIKRGQSTTYNVSITRSGGFTGAVNLGVKGQTPNDAVSFNPASIAAGSTTSVLMVKTSTRDARATLTITGTAGSLTHAATATLALK
jgi:hypothetical protein